jgi:hypothetical protein
MHGLGSLSFVLIVGAIAFVYSIGAKATGFHQGKSRHFYKPYRPVVDQRDPAQQLNAVMAGAFRKQRLMNGGEYRVFRIVEADIAAARRGYRVFAQTSLGEVLDAPDNKNAYYAINSKRVDMLIVDQDSWPVAAVEYQGSGHYQGNAAARDAIKKEALRKAGIRYIEVSADDSDAQIRARLREHLGLHLPSNVASTPKAPSSNAPEPAPRTDDIRPDAPRTQFGRRTDVPSSGFGKAVSAHHS